MNKDFDKWNQMKKKIENKNIFFEFHEREIYWANIGENVGEEICGKNDNFERPVLVLKKHSKEGLFVLPITSTIRDGSYFCNLFLNGTERSILLHQGRFLSRNRLLRKIGSMSISNFDIVTERYNFLYKNRNPLAGESRVPNGKDIYSVANEIKKSSSNLSNPTEIKLLVPYCSQIIEIKDEIWQKRGCSITCLGMAIKYFNKKINLDINNLLAEAIKFNCYDQEIGYWVHQKIALLAHNYGVPCYAEEFRSRRLGVKTEYEENMRELGIQKIIQNILENKLVIFSMPKDWQYEDKYHSSLLLGLKFKDEQQKELLGFYYHDPSFTNQEEGAFKFIELEKFKNLWRGLAIFVG